MKREYPTRPIPAVGAVIFSGNKVLLIKRGKHPSKGQWSLPGGAVRIGETCKQALGREVYEETCLKVDVKALVAVVERIVRDKDRVKYHYVILDYWAEHIDGIAKACSDAQDIKWVGVKDLPILGINKQTQEVIMSAWNMRATTNAPGPSKGQAGPKAATL